jgi:hypothetical protein
MFAKVTKQGLLHFLTKRLPVYAVGIFILLVGGIKGLMITFLCVMSFFLGWFINKLITAVKDYRLTQRLNRIHFTHIEYDTMKRERDMALDAFRQIDKERTRGLKAAPMPPMPPSSHNRIDQDEIREMARRYLEEEGAL